MVWVWRGFERRGGGFGGDLLLVPVLVFDLVERKGVLFWDRFVRATCSDRDVLVGCVVLSCSVKCGQRACSFMGFYHGVGFEGFGVISLPGL